MACWYEMKAATRSTAASIWLCAPLNTWRLRAATTLASSPAHRLQMLAQGDAW